MNKKSSIFALICLLVVVTVNISLVSAQTRTAKDAASVAVIKADVAKYGSDEKKRVQVKLLDGTKT